MQIGILLMLALFKGKEKSLRGTNVATPLQFSAIAKLFISLLINDRYANTNRNN